MKDTYYFIAIGGIGMSGLAKYLVEDGYEVLGSDIKQNRNTTELEKLGAKIFIGHDEKNLPEHCTIVASTAIKEDNPELIKAKRLGLEILHRSDLLARVGNYNKKYFLGYSGTHGKTTTSGLSAYVLQKANLNPSFVVGGIVPEFGINSNAGAGDYFVAELDESDGTIIKYSPEISVINNLELDHVDFYTDGMDSILRTFKQYLSTLPEGAKVIINNDNWGNRSLIEHNPDANFITFGLKNADYMAKNISLGLETTFDIYKNNEFITDLKTQMLGIHNVYNTLAVFASLYETGINPELIKNHFYTFTGMGRRFQKSAELDNISIYDDYAHHPTEIKATLSAMKAIKDKKIIAVFQPHRYSRFTGLWNEFLQAFEGVDKVYVTDVYAASEDPIEAANPAKFAQELSKTVPCEHISGTIQEVAEKLLPKLDKNSVVVGLGAGTITALGKDLLEARKKVNA